MIIKNGRDCLNQWIMVADLFYCDGILWLPLSTLDDSGTRPPRRLHFGNLRHISETDLNQESRLDLKWNVFSFIRKSPWHSPTLSSPDVLAISQVVLLITVKIIFIIKFDSSWIRINCSQAVNHPAHKQEEVGIGVEPGLPTKKMNWFE